MAFTINRRFEPVWESVRPVPTVRIDFGNGTVVTRTLHGSIATCVCAADGQALDILPGIYAPATYLHCLEQLSLLANYVDQAGVEKRGDRLQEYHQGQLAALKNAEAPPQFISEALVTKAFVGNRLKAVLVAGGQAGHGTAAPETEEPTLDSADDVANWKVLAEDTRLNETVRRQQIHEMMLVVPSNRITFPSGPVRPDQATRWLCRKVLHTELDDPYLGLGNVLFANYPFAKEDMRR